MLGKFPLPIEVIPMARSYVAREVVKMGGHPELRQGFTTDNGNVVLDCHGMTLLDPPKTEAEINQIAGVVSSGMAIYDTMQHLRAPINTICMGMAASTGSFLLAAGTKGKRAALPHARIVIHQPSGGTQGTAADIEIQAREILYLRGKMNELYAKHTGQPIERIEKDMERDRFMSADEALQYGLIDTVFAPRKAPAATG